MSESKKTRDEQAVIALIKVRAAMSGSLTEQGFQQWLYAPNLVLEGWSPAQLLDKGNLQDVLNAAYAFNDGSYV